MNRASQPEDAGDDEDAAPTVVEVAQAAAALADAVAAAVAEAGTDSGSPAVCQVQSMSGVFLRWSRPATTVKQLFRDTRLNPYVNSCKTCPA